MTAGGTIRVGVNGFGVIGKRVVEAVLRQDDMELAGVADVATDWRVRRVTEGGIRLYAATNAGSEAMSRARLDVSGALEDLLEAVDVVVDCTPKRIAAEKAERYRRAGVKFIVQGGEKHDVTGHSFVAEVNYESALDRASTRVVSCNTTSVVRTLTALKRAGLLVSAEGRSCAGPRTRGRATLAAPRAGVPSPERLLHGQRVPRAGEVAQIVKGLLRKGEAQTGHGHRIRMLAFGSTLPQILRGSIPLGMQVVQAKASQNWTESESKGGSDGTSDGRKHRSCDRLLLDGNRPRSRYAHIQWGPGGLGGRYR